MNVYLSKRTVTTTRVSISTRSLRDVRLIIVKTVSNRVTIHSHSTTLKSIRKSSTSGIQERHRCHPKSLCPSEGFQSITTIDNSKTDIIRRINFIFINMFTHKSYGVLVKTLCFLFDHFSCGKFLSSNTHNHIQVNGYISMIIFIFFYVNNCGKLSLSIFRRGWFPNKLKRRDEQRL